MVSEGSVSAGHARALLSVSDPELMARKIVDQGLSVRDIERIVQEEWRGETKSIASKPKVEKDPDTRAVEKALEEALGLSVSISHRANGSGEVKISKSFTCIYKGTDAAGAPRKRFPKGSARLTHPPPSLCPPSRETRKDEKAEKVRAKVEEFFNAEGQRSPSMRDQVSHTLPTLCHVIRVLATSSAC